MAETEAPAQGCRGFWTLVNRPHCLPGCDRLDGHDGYDPGACMRGGQVLYPGRTRCPQCLAPLQQRCTRCSWPGPIILRMEICGADVIMGEGGWRPR